MSELIPLDNVGMIEFIKLLDKLSDAHISANGDTKLKTTLVDKILEENDTP